MALQRFIESYTTIPQHVNSSPSLREKYREAITQSTIPSIQRLVEKVNDQELELYRFPISRFDWLNQNKRKYPRKLWEKVINDQQAEWKNKVGLCDHPPADSDGEFKDAAILWLDMEIDDVNKLIWAIGTFVGGESSNGELAHDIVRKGGRIGFSSSGFGELLGDRETVDPSSYVLERCADIVLNPSQDVFGEAEDALNIEYTRQEPIKDSIKHESVSRIKETRMDQQDTLTEGTVKIAPISRQEEKKFRRDISRYLEDADKMESPQARLAELTDILSFFEEGAAPDLRVMVEEKILAEKAELEKMATEAQRVQETFGVESNEQLKIGVALLAEEIKVVSAEAKDWEKISLAMKENNKALRKALQESQSELSQRPTLKDLEEAQSRIVFLESQRKRQLLAYNEETQALEGQLGKNKDSMLQISERVEEVTKILTRKTQEIDSLKERLLVAEKIAADRKQLVESIGKEKAEYDAVLSEAKKTIDHLTSQIERLQSNLQEANNDKEAIALEFAHFKEESIKANTPNLLPKFSERTKGFLNFDEAGGAAVESYWSDLLSRYGESILPYERQIRTCKTYREAYSQFLKIQSAIDESAKVVTASRLPESVAISRTERLEALTDAGMNYGSKGVMDRNTAWAL